MRNPAKQRLRLDRPDPQERRGKPGATGNTRLAEQIRKILRKHDAGKDRVR
jgi:hypothetical protein